MIVLCLVFGGFIRAVYVPLCIDDKRRVLGASAICLGLGLAESGIVSLPPAITSISVKAPTNAKIIVKPAITHVARAVLWAALSAGVFSGAFGAAGSGWLCPLELVTIC